MIPIGTLLVDDSNSPPALPLPPPPLSLSLSLSLSLPLSHCVNIVSLLLVDDSENGGSFDPIKLLTLRKTSLQTTRSLDAGVFDVLYDVPMANGGTRRSDLTAFVFRVEIGNSVKYIVQVSFFTSL